jgi:hypothetical protein
MRERRGKKIEVRNGLTEGKGVVILANTAGGSCAVQDNVRGGVCEM